MDSMRVLIGCPVVRFWFADKRIHRAVLVALLLVTMLVLIQPVITSALAGFGGYVSEKLLGDGVDEALYLGDGTGLTVLGSAPAVSTEGATSSSAGGTVTMTLVGDLVSLNGMPRADVWFLWGYNESGVMTYTTTLVTVTSAGNQATTIYPDAGRVVYYRFVASTDSVASGAVQHQVAGGGHGISYWLMNTFLPIVIAGVILVAVLLLTGNPILALVSSIIGLAGFYIVLALVSSF